MNNRLSKLRKEFEKNRIDGMFITQAHNRRYLSGFHGTAGYLIISAKKAVLATDFRYTEQAANQAPDFEIFRITGPIKEWLARLLSDLNIRNLGFEGGDVSFDFYEDICRAAGNKAKLTATNGITEGIRAVKEPEEIELIKKASEITDAAYEQVEKKIKPGMTEKQVAWQLEKTMREMGSEALPFDVIVGSGPNAAMPHARPTDRPIGKGETVVIDMGAKYMGYASDLTRTICAGGADAKAKEVYNTVYKAQHTAKNNITRGMTGQEADRLARDIIKQAGYGDAFGHSLGHGVGLAEHELPYLSPSVNGTLTDGMVFTVEPGIYLEGWGGVRIEDTVVMENGKAVPLTKARKAIY